MQPVEAQPEARLQSALDSVAPEKPFEVGIGIQVEQIVSVNQKAENFEVVGNLRLIWDDPKLAFESREHDRPFLIYNREQFVKFTVDHNMDFGKSIDIAGANLLIFVAFNFTISSDLPRLGYMTFMDAIVLITFVFSSLVVITNVMFRRMEVVGKESLTRRIDNIRIWAYPFTLAALAVLCWYWFVVEKAHI